jgi:hypothetical protein
MKEHHSIMNQNSKYNIKSSFLTDIIHLLDAAQAFPAVVLISGAPHLVLYPE